MHSPPYAVPDDVQLDAHNPPDVVRRALNSLPRGANADSSKRPRTQAPVVSEQPAQITSLPASSSTTTTATAAISVFRCWRRSRSGATSAQTAPWRLWLWLW